jgi:hypothetical protein
MIWQAKSIEHRTSGSEMDESMIGLAECFDCSGQAISICR